MNRAVFHSTRCLLRDVEEEHSSSAKIWWMGREILKPIYELLLPLNTGETLF